MNRFFLALMLFGTLMACTKDEDDDNGHSHSHNSDPLEYAIDIQSPDTLDKHMGDTISLDVLFSCNEGQTVHNINVRIHQMGLDSNVYSMPLQEHVHSADLYLFSDELILSTENGFSAHSNWVLEAKVWGHENMEGLTTESVHFHVHP